MHICLEVTVAEEGIRKTVVVDGPSGKGGLFFIYLLFLGLFLVSVILFCWFRDIIREGSYQGKYTIKVLSGLKYGFILFIVS